MSRASSPSAAGRYGTARVCRVWEVPRSTVYARRARARPHRATCGEARTEAGMDGRGADRADSLGARRLAVHRRGLPQGLGAAAPGRSAHLEGPGAAADAGGGPVRPDPGRAPPRAAQPRRHDHHRAPRRNVGDRRDCLPHHPRGQRYRLHRRRPLHTGVRRHPRGAPRHALRGAGAAAPGAAGTLRRLRGGRRHGACAAPRPRQPVHERTTSRASCASSASARARRSWPRPRATAAPSASSARSRSSCSGSRRSRRSSSCASRCSRSKTATTRLGSSSATATVPRPPFARRSRRAPERPHDYRLRGVQESGSGTLRRSSSGSRAGTTHSAVTPRSTTSARSTTNGGSPLTLMPRNLYT